jgi:hypothetical protein
MPIQGRTATASESLVGLDGCVPKYAPCVFALCSSQEQSVCIVSPAPRLALLCHSMSKTASVTALTRASILLPFLRKGLKPRQAPNGCRPRSGRSRRPRYSPSLSLQPSSVSLGLYPGPAGTEPRRPIGRDMFLDVSNLQSQAESTHPCPSLVIPGTTSALVPAPSSTPDSERFVLCTGPIQRINSGTAAIGKKLLLCALRCAAAALIVDDDDYEKEDEEDDDVAVQLSHVPVLKQRL